MATVGDHQQRREAIPSPRPKVDILFCLVKTSWDDQGNMVGAKTVLSRSHVKLLCYQASDTQNPSRLQFFNP